jgi:hypothetical protein
MAGPKVVIKIRADNTGAEGVENISILCVSAAKNFFSSRQRPGDMMEVLASI